MLQGIVVSSCGRKIWKERTTVSRTASTEWILLPLVLLLLLSGAVQATEHFEPLADTLERYGVFSLPQADEFPGMPAVVVLSVEEYRQISTAGKDYTTVSIPCYSACHILARTIKADGRIINLPAKDVVHPERFSEYAAPFSVIDFSFPGVEVGDILEYKSEVTFPEPFLAEDYRFGDRCPIRKGVFILTHPDDYSYSFTRQSSPNGVLPKSSTVAVQVGSQRMLRTTFVVDDVPPISREKLAPDVRFAQPGMRLFIQKIAGRPLSAFLDWFSYGKFIGDRFKVPALVMGPIKKFVRDAVGKSTEPPAILAQLQRAVDRHVQIVPRPAMVPGFPLQSVEEVFKNRIGTPEDYALFLAACLKDQKWSVELVLVNSHDRPLASKKVAFPPDLDMVFLNVKTPTGEYLLDCNSNGNIPGMIPSSGANRLALAIPVTFDFQQVDVSPALTTVPEQSGNRSEFEATATPGPDSWSISFRWSLKGEFHAGFRRTLQRYGEADLKKEVATFLKSRIHADRVSDITYTLGTSGIELRGKAAIARKIVKEDLEILQNELWDSGFDIRRYMVEGRTNPLLLPVAGEISSTLRFRLDRGVQSTLPTSYDLQCDPLRYTLTASSGKGELTVQERITIRDLLVRNSTFDGFCRFLEQYHRAHYWSVLLSSRFAPPVASAIQRMTYLAAPAKPAPSRKAPVPPCSATIRVSGRLARNVASVDVSNLSGKKIERGSLKVHFIKGDYVEESETVLPQLTSGEAQHLLLHAIYEYPKAEVLVRFLQDGAWRECGPYPLVTEGEDP
jgi:hypothetical protein